MKLQRLIECLQAHLNRHGNIDVQYVDFAVEAPVILDIYYAQIARIGSPTAKPVVFLSQLERNQEGGFVER